MTANPARHRLAAQLRNRHCQHSEQELARALQGNWRAEHLFALQRAVELYEFYHQQIATCDRQIEAHLQTFTDKSTGKALPHRPRKRKRRATEPRFAARPPLFRVAGVDLTAIEGIDETTALVLLSEIGTDMSRWPTEKHFASKSNTGHWYTQAASYEHSRCEVVTVERLYGRGHLGGVVDL